MAIKLPRLPVGWQSTPELFERYWDQAMGQIESSINGILAATAAAAAANAAAVSANTAATAATTAAASATTAATTATNQSNIANSYVTGCSVTATDAGASATIAISAHTRVYGDGSTVSVSGGSITGLSYSTMYYVYYDQPSRAGGAVTYVSTTVSSDAAQLNNRHVVGSVTTPAALGSPSNGDEVRPPGSGTLP